MKALLLTFLVVGFLSCSKENLSVPAASIQTSPAISYRSNNISISDFKAQASGGQITVGFITLFQKDVKSLEILKGTTPNNLCSIYKTDGTTASQAVLNYSTEDTQSASTLYYIVKYTLQSGDWGYTPVFTLALQTAQ